MNRVVIRFRFIQIIMVGNNPVYALCIKILFAMEIKKYIYFQGINKKILYSNTLPFWPISYLIANI